MKARRDGPRFQGDDEHFCITNTLALNNFNVEYARHIALY